MKLITEEELNTIKNKIKISKPGSFTEYCHGQVSCACMHKALLSNDPSLHRKANFAYNFGYKRNGKICPEIENMRKEHK